MYEGDIRLGETIDIKFCTVNTGGTPTVLAGSPVVSAYVGNGTTQITAGITLSVDFDGVVGLNNVRVVATSGNGFATATNVQLVITTGTVGGVSVVGYVVASFSIENRSAVMPTTAARTLDVSAGGEAGLDWANIGSPTTAQNLSATNIDVDQIVASVSGAVASVTGNVGGNVTGSVGSVATGGITAASIATDAIGDLELATDAYAAIADAVWDEDATGHQTQGTFGQAIGDPVADTNTLFKAVVTDAAGATVGVDIVAVKAETVAILDDTDDIGVAGAGLTAINLPDQAMNITGDITGNLSGSVGSVTGAVGSVTGLTNATIADAVLDEDMTAHQTQGTLGQAIGDPAADANTIFKAVVSDSTGATVGLDVVAVKAETADILADTAEIGTAGAGLTNINLPNQTMDIVGNITGNLSGTVGSVTGAVGSVTASVTANATAIDSSTAAASSLRRGVLGNVLGTVDTGSTTTSIITSSLAPAAAVTDQFKGRILTFKDDTTTANLRGQATDITASTAGGVLTVTPLTTAPVSGDSFVIT